jgi:hypothetical protein
MQPDVRGDMGPSQHGHNDLKCYTMAIYIAPHYPSTIPVGLVVKAAQHKS